MSEPEDSAPKRVLTLKDLTKINEVIQEKTSSNLVLVGDMRRGILTERIEYLTCKSLNLVGAALSLPNSMNLRENVQKISYAHPAGVEVCIRYVAPEKLAVNVFIYTGPKDFVRAVTKELQKKEYKLSKDGLLHKDEPIAIKKESQLFALIEKVLEIKLDPANRDASVIKPRKKKRD